MCNRTTHDSVAVSYTHLIILAENKEKKGTYIVIDGKQRLLSLQQFVEGDDCLLYTSLHELFR